MTDEEILAILENYDDNLKDMVNGLLIERKVMQEKIKELETSQKNNALWNSYLVGRLSKVKELLKKCEG